MVEGARKLAPEHGLYFMTLTCRGDLSLDDAEKQYLGSTNAVLDAFRWRVKHVGSGFWAYASVTERQRRGHPHSHYLMSCKPDDAFYPVDDYARYVASVKAISSQISPPMRFSPISPDRLSHLDMHSEWLMLQAVRSGLGVQARVSRVDLVEGASRYVAKYLFKSSMFTPWPKKWRRVRYSRSWPKMPSQAPSTAFPVLTRADWLRVKFLRRVLVTHDAAVYDLAMRHHCFNVTCDVPNGIDLPEGQLYTP